MGWSVAGLARTVAEADWAAEGLEEEATAAKDQEAAEKALAGQEAAVREEEG